MNSKPLIFGLTTLFVSASAFAQAAPSTDPLTLIQTELAKSRRALVLTAGELRDLGLTVTELTDGSGEVRHLNPKEPVKIEIHEEDGHISFSSFDTISRPVHVDHSHQPRNITIEAAKTKF